MKEKLTRNIGLKVLAIILAAILWLVITNVDDPVTPVSFSNIQVQVLNADSIKALNQVYNITEGSTISFTAAARRSVADKLDKDDFKVTADLSKLSDLNIVSINIKYLGLASDGVTITSGLNQVMKVELEDLVNKDFRVTVTQTGEVSEGCYVYEKTAGTILKISGPKSKIEKIAQVVVDVDVTGYTRSFSTTEEPKALDEKGKEIDDTNLTFSRNYIPVNVGIYNTKEIPLNITPVGVPASGYVMSGIEYDPQIIEIAAADDVLSQIRDLSITEDISGASSKIEKEINLQEQLPDGAILVGDTQTAVVNISFEKPTTKEITIRTSDIEVRNAPDDLKLEYLTTGTITIALSGPKSEINELKKDDIKPYIDLANYIAGTYSLIVETDITGYSTVVNMPTVSFHLTRE
jgi:YbbR domain-containing protein